MKMRQPFSFCLEQYSWNIHEKSLFRESYVNNADYSWNIHEKGRSRESYVNNADYFWIIHEKGFFTESLGLYNLFSIIIQKWMDDPALSVQEMSLTDTAMV